MEENTLTHIHNSKVVFDRSGMKVVLGNDFNAYANNTGSDYLYIDDHELIAWKQINIYPYSSIESFFKESFHFWYDSLEDNKKALYMKEIFEQTLEMHIPF